MADNRSPQPTRYMTKDAEVGWKVKRNRYRKDSESPLVSTEFCGSMRDATYYFEFYYKFASTSDRILLERPDGTMAIQVCGRWGGNDV